MPLGCGNLAAFLYDRGGITRLAKFDGIVEAQWERLKNDVSSAHLTISVNLCGCDFLGDIRAMRHELVIFRDDLRVWEGPITRVVYTADTVEVNAKDVLVWLSRRVNRGRFQTGNIVDVAAQIVRDAFSYDDPNVTPYLYPMPATGGNFTAAWNRAENTYLDALNELVEAGLAYATNGRRVMLWPATRVIGKTPVLRSPQDLAAPVSVVEDGLSLASRIVVAGNDTFGAAGGYRADMSSPYFPQVVPEPVVVNYSNNPSLEANANGYEARLVPSTKLASSYGFKVNRVSGTQGFGSGRFVGQLQAQPPIKPTLLRRRPHAPHLGRRGGSNAAEWDDRKEAFAAAMDNYQNDLKNWEVERAVTSAQREAYNQALQAYTDTEIVLTMYGQRIKVSEGELVSALLYVKGFGTKLGSVGMRLRGVDADGDIQQDRAFEENTGVFLGGKWTGIARMIWVQGVVPKDTAWAFAEVYRSTTTKWDTSNNGFYFDKFAMFRGRKEAWFDGGTPDTADHTYTWVGTPNNSNSYHFWANDVPGVNSPRPLPWQAAEYRDRMSGYYGLVELLEDTSSQTREAMETEALNLVKKSYPTPLLVDVPGDTPLLPTAPTDIRELVAGTTVPVQTTVTCRRARADTSLTQVLVTYGTDGELVTVTLTGGQVWEIQDDIQPLVLADERIDADRRPPVTAQAMTDAF